MVNTQNEGVLSDPIWDLYEGHTRLDIRSFDHSLYVQPLACSLSRLSMLGDSASLMGV